MSRINGKSIAVAAAAVVLIAALSVGATLAYTMKLTGGADNRFTLVSMNGIDALIKETAHPEHADGLATSSKVTNAVSVRNASAANIDTWLGVKLTFQKGDYATPADMSALAQMLEIQFDGKPGFNTTDWIRANTGALQQEEIFYYGAILKKGDETRPLFDQVRIKDIASNDVVDVVDNWSGFNIRVSGAVVQGDLSATFDDQVKAELNHLLDTKRSLK